MPRSRKKTIVILACVVIGGIAIARHFRSADHDTAGHHGAAHPLAPVAMATAKKENFPVWLTGLGTVTPVYTVTIKSRVDGELVKVYFKEGDRVHRGDPLVDIDPRPYEVQRDQALGQLTHDQALLDNARIDLQRYQTLVKTGAIPEQQLVTQQALVTQYEGTVLTDKSQVDNAKLQLIYSHITAPVDGRLGIRMVDQGNMILAAASLGLVVLTQLSPITVIFPLPQDYLPQIQQAMKGPEPLRVEAWDRTNQFRLATGVLQTLDNQVDTTTGMVKLRAQFDNKQDELFPNLFVNARLRVTTLPDATVIPVAGVQQGNQGPFVFIVDDKMRISLRKIKPGPTEGDQIAIVEGLAPGERVVTDGVDNLREGMTVTLASKAH
ncbi:MAG: MdtA/MuxA family multidrug efflux RND transporter periplasmic adaptor subunit [Ferrovum sp.]|nr:MdtA/MuxA family multidrug efflux RND transporter periplasmic adaptor subunit [Ferrovum sp.]NDU86806.1 MdtA/MuxA family multidrug efflux RND transporter periplasmic adaptor subunit [Ferrovum sp.]